MSPASILSLACSVMIHRRRQELQKPLTLGFAADMEQAAICLRQLATILIRGEAENEQDPARRRRLVAEAAEVWARRAEATS